MLLDERIRLSVSCSRQWRASAAAVALVVVAVLSLITLRPVPAANADEQRPALQPAENTITGIVQDENKIGLGNAPVRLFLIDYGNEQAQRQLQETHAKKEGRFEFTVPDMKQIREQHARLVVVAQWPHRATTWDFADEGHVTGLALTLVPAGTLEGRVTDLDGKPVAGATVWTSNGLLRPVPGICAAVSDAKGKYSISDIRP